MDHSDVIDVIADIRGRLQRMPVFAGTGTTIPALPAPEDVPERTWVYPHPHWFMEAVRHPFWPLVNYAIEAPPVGL